MEENKVCEAIDEIYKKATKDEPYNMSLLDRTYKDEEGTYITKIAFGNNGTPNWPGYLTHLASVLIEAEKDEKVNRIYLTKIEVDALDDISTAYIATALNE